MAAQNYVGPVKVTDPLGPPQSAIGHQPRCYPARQESRWVEDGLLC